MKPEGSMTGRSSSAAPNFVNVDKSNTDERAELRKKLLTCDGVGTAAKTEALDTLIKIEIGKVVCEMARADSVLDSYLRRRRGRETVVSAWRKKQDAEVDRVLKRLSPNHWMNSWWITFCIFVGLVCAAIMLVNFYN